MIEFFSNSIELFKTFFKDHIPFTNPVLILSLVLLIILFSPIIFKKFGIPGIIGLILAGVIIGPNTLHIIEKTTSFDLFSKTGLLYIMFLAGLEIDMQEFKQNRSKSLVFGVFTFFIPIILGYYVCVYVFKMDFLAALLLASMFSTHTLLSYPIVSNMGIVKNKAVQVAFGGTIITDTAVLVLLGIITNMKNGEFGSAFLVSQTIRLSLLIVGVLYLFPKISRWFFRNIEGQGSSQYIYVLAVVFLSAFASELAGVEPIIGAFLAGLALNRVIPHNSVLMNRVIFIGNTLFIPFFLISSGMLVDLRLFFTSTDALIFSLLLSFVALLTKYLAAYFTGKIFSFSKDETRIIFGLSASHAAATLAIIKVGFDIGLFDQNVINGTIILILITCMASSFVTERAGRKIAISESDKESDVKLEKRPERIMIPISNPENCQRLIDFSLLIKNPKGYEPIYPLSIVEDDREANEKLNGLKKLLENISDQVSSVDKKVEILKKVDINIVDGIVRTAKAYSITDIIVSYRGQQNTSNFIFGSISDNLIEKSEQHVWLCKIVQPINSFRHISLLLTPNAELELTFRRTCLKINRILKQVGEDVYVYGTESTINAFQVNVNDKNKNMFRYHILENFDNPDFIENNYSGDDLFVILNSRKQTVSFDYHIDNIPKELNKRFEYSSFIVFYPEHVDGTQSAYNEMANVTVQENVEKIIKVKDKITDIFKRSD